MSPRCEAAEDRHREVLARLDELRSAVGDLAREARRQGKLLLSTHAAVEATLLHAVARQGKPRRSR